MSVSSKVVGGTAEIGLAELEARFKNVIRMLDTYDSERDLGIKTSFKVSSYRGSPGNVAFSDHAFPRLISGPCAPLGLAPGGARDSRRWR